jgi:hypothetical protein
MSPSGVPIVLRPLLTFLASSILLLAALALAAAHAPPRLKLLGLFPAAVGVAAGAGIALLGERHGIGRRRIIVTTVLLAPLALAGYAAESYRAWRQARADEIAANLLAQPGGKAILDDIRSGRPGRNETESEFFVAYRRRMNPLPAAYLTERLKGSPVETGMPWAAVIAAAELLLACAAGIAAAVLASCQSRSAL